jgi:phthalate 4,5-cis-dihydrodiol dehydrogenase
MSMKTVNVGVAGIGFMGATHIKSYLKIPGARLGAICDAVRLPVNGDLSGIAGNIGDGKPLQLDMTQVKAYSKFDDLLADPAIDLVDLCVPTPQHHPLCLAALQAGKHVVCEKPMATSVAECNEIVAAIEAGGVKYVQGHSKIYYSAIRRMREAIKSGDLGRVTQINTWNFNDWLIRPRVASEENTELGTGPVFRQGPHQVDIVRYLAGSPVASVRAVTARHEAASPATESDYTALLTFENGAAATLVFNAQGYFDVTELTWGIGESGYRTINADSIRPAVRHPVMTAEEKQRFAVEGDPYGRGTAGGEDRRSLRKQPFFGITVVHCERGALRQSPDGVYVYDKTGRRELACGAGHARGSAELMELADALSEGREPFLDAAWGRATLEVCVAILESAQQRREIELKYQVPAQPVGTW